MGSFKLAAILAGPVLCLACATGVSGEPPEYRAGMQGFEREMARKHGIGPDELADILGPATYRQEVIDAIRRPWEAKPWFKYRQLFLTEARIEGGVEFRREHADLLERARKVYGVPPEIITAIIGIETNYGGNLGRHRVVDALSTLGFSYPPRADFFRKELEQFVLLARDEGIDAAGVTGSYAGAVGMPQFIPSSYRAYAVDFDGDGRRDLWDSKADVIGSVASYLKRNGWEGGQPVAYRVELSGPLPSGVRVADRKPVKPETPAGRLRAAGIRIEPSVPDSEPVTLIRLEAGENQHEHWVGLANFYAITRYNHSNLYAMAVYQLSREIGARQRAAQGAGATAD